MNKITFIRIIYRGERGLMISVKRSNGKIRVYNYSYKNVGLLYQVSDVSLTISSYGDYNTFEVG